MYINETYFLQIINCELLHQLMYSDGVSEKL